MSFRNRLAALSAITLGAAAPAFAAVPAAAEGIFTVAATDFGTVLGWGYTLMIAVVGGLIVLGLVKKVAGKAV